MIRLSVIVPLYNCEKYLEKAIDSVLQQNLSLDEYEIIIVDDGSADRGKNIAEELSKKYDNIKVFSQQNQGPGIARNLGIEKAKGKYLLFLDADDYLEPSTINSALSLAEREQLDILYFNYREKRGKNISIEPFKFNTDLCGKLMTGEESIAKFKFYHSVWSCIYNKDFVLKSCVRFENQFWGEDVLFIIKLMLQAQRTERVNKVCYNYIRYNIKSLTNSRNKDKSHLRRVVSSRIDVTIKINKIIEDIEKRRGIINIECLQVLREAVSIFSQCALYKLVHAGYTTEELRIKLNEMQQSGIYPIGDRKEYSTVRDKILKILLNHKWMIFFLNKVL